MGSLEALKKVVATSAACLGQYALRCDQHQGPASSYHCSDVEVPHCEAQA